MLKKYFENLEFILENLFISTRAVGLAIVDADGNIAAECGRLDIDLFSDTASRLYLNSSKLLEEFSGSSEELLVWTEASKGRFVLADLSDNFLLLVFYPKDIDIFSIRDNIMSFVSEIKEVFIEIKPHIRG